MLGPDSAAASAVHEALAGPRPDDTASTRLEDLVGPSRAPVRVCLTVMRGAQVGRSYELSGGEVSLGRGDEVTIALQDPAVSRRHAAIQPSPLGFIITDLDSTNGLFVNGKRAKRHALRDGDRIQIGTSVFKFSHQDELEESLHKRLYESATRDVLLGIHNKQYFLDNLKAAFANATRKQVPLSMLILDVDRFKHINDGHGHLAGDHILKEIAEIVQRSVRTEDVFARFGGEEFVLLLTETARGPASLVAERIRSSIELHSFEYDGRRVRLTISIGVCTYADGNFPTPQSLIAGADAALYQAKRGGRNRVVWRGSPEPSPDT